ncbi:uncharacterized protein [Choristoneura fumiferana]|uniref:uncharacterized protein n=1 Tax=Choristoneura fumiferana TaxID=7141 RepID=UPI003D1566C2
MAKCLNLLLLVAVSQVCDAYKILVIFPLPGRSHNNLGQGIVRHLLEAGHEVTYVTPFPTNKTTSKYHEVDLSDMLKKFTDFEKKFALKKILDKEVAVDLAGAFTGFVTMTTMSMKNYNLQNFLSDTTQNFDAVIVEWLFSDVYAGYAAVFNCPLIWLSSIEPHGLVLKLVHESSNPAFNSDALTTAVPPFSFVERGISLLRQLGINAVKFFYFDSFEKKLYEEFFGPKIAKRGRAVPAYEDVVFNSSFLLTNSYPAVSQPISMPPNTKEIGGYHIDPNPKPLPADLQKLMDEAEHGVIYFSMGSNAKSKDFPDVLKQNFLRVLGDVKQTVIWKFEEDLPNRPKNVHIVQWAPQTSILAHPNCRLFITHGGLLSTTETIFFGVPTIVMPYGADQHVNAIRAVKKGYALRVDMSYEMASDMKLAVDEMLGNPKYTERVKALSKLYHDRLVPPGKELVHWVEHVVRTGGAPHLRSPALMLPWYQKMYLDLAAVILIVLYVLKKLLSKVKSLFSKKIQNVDQKKDNYTKMAKFLHLLLLAALSQMCDAYKILLFFPMTGRSHNILGQGYVRHLLEAGHEVTYVTPYPTNKTTAKYHEIDLSINVAKFDDIMYTIQQILDKEAVLDITGLIPKLHETITMSVNTENFQKFLSDTTQNFDVVIAEWLFSDVYAGLAAVYNCPFIWSSSIEPHWLVLRLIHESSDPAFNPDIFTTTSPPFSFVDRAGSLFRQIAMKAVKYFYLDGFEQKIYKDYFGPAVAKRGRVLPNYYETVFNASFMLANSHPALSQPISMPPNVKEIGGYHINPEVKPLPADLQKLMDEAQHGVIYFSMGSNVKSKDFPESLKQDLFRVLGEFKQTVIWKFEEDLPNKPKNIHVVQWAPQQSILAHRNCRLFITHGGLLSTTETIFFGVPTIVIPYGADQHLNALRAVKKGYALMVELSYEIPREIKVAVDEMMNNPKYTERVKELSKLYHDRLVPPGKELVHWVEHVVRTGGALHLRSPALMLPWYQKMYLDLTAVIVLILYVLKKLFNKGKSLIYTRTQSNKVKTN